MLNMMFARSSSRPFPTVCFLRSNWANARPNGAFVAHGLRLEPCGNGDASHLINADDVVLPVAAIKLREGKYELGRVDPADLVVPLPTVSARHAIVNVGGDGSVTVVDLASTNGSFIDGVELKPQQVAVLEIGSEVVFGDKNLAAFRLINVADDDDEEEAK